MHTSSNQEARTRGAGGNTNDVLEDRLVAIDHIGAVIRHPQGLVDDFGGFGPRAWTSALLLEHLLHVVRQRVKLQAEHPRLATVPALVERIRLRVLSLRSGVCCRALMSGACCWALFGGLAGFGTLDC